MAVNLDIQANLSGNATTSLQTLLTSIRAIESSAGTMGQAVSTALTTLTGRAALTATSFKTLYKEIQTGAAGAAADLTKISLALTPLKTTLGKFSTKPLIAPISPTTLAALPNLPGIIERIGLVSTAGAAGLNAFSAATALMTPNVKAANTALNTMFNRFTKIQTALTAMPAASMTGTTASINTAAAATQKLGTNASSAGQGFDGLNVKAQALAATFLAIRLGKEFVDVGSSLDGTRNAFESISGSAEEAQSEIARLRELADRLGVSYEGLTRQMVNMRAATAGTTLEGREATRIFDLISQKMALLGRSSDDVKGALVAVQQVISKGTLSAEELRQQLAERLPGSFNLAAKALNVTTAQLSKMLELGLIKSAEFIPKFSDALEKSMVNGSGRVETFRASIERMHNEWNLLVVQIGKAGVFKALEDAFKGVTNALSVFTATSEQSKTEVTDLSIALKLAKSSIEAFDPQIAALVTAFSAASIAVAAFGVELVAIPIILAGIPAAIAAGPVVATTALGYGLGQLTGITQELSDAFSALADNGKTLGNAATAAFDKLRVSAGQTDPALIKTQNSILAIKLATEGFDEASTRASDIAVVEYAKIQSALDKLKAKQTELGAESRALNASYEALRDSNDATVGSFAQFGIAATSVADGFRQMDEKIADLIGKQDALRNKTAELRLEHEQGQKTNAVVLRDLTNLGEGYGIGVEQLQRLSYETVTHAALAGKSAIDIERLYTSIDTAASILTGAAAKFKDGKVNVDSYRGSLLLAATDFNNLGAIALLESTRALAATEGMAVEFGKSTRFMSLDLAELERAFKSLKLTSDAEFKAIANDVSVAFGKISASFKGFANESTFIRSAAQAIKELNSPAGLEAFIADLIKTGQETGQTREAIVAMVNTAVLKIQDLRQETTLLGQNLKTIGLEMDDLEQGMTTSGKVVIDTFASLSASATSTEEYIRLVSQTLSKLSDTDDVEALIGVMGDLGAQAGVSGAAIDQAMGLATERARALRKDFDDIGTAMEGSILKGANLYRDTSGNLVKLATNSKSAIDAMHRLQEAFFAAQIKEDDYNKTLIETGKLLKDAGDIAGIEQVRMLAAVQGISVEYGKAVGFLSENLRGVEAAFESLGATTGEEMAAIANDSIKAFEEIKLAYDANQIDQKGLEDAYKQLAAVYQKTGDIQTKVLLDVAGRTKELRDENQLLKKSMEDINQQQAIAVAKSKFEEMTAALDIGKVGIESMTEAFRNYASLVISGGNVIEISQLKGIATTEEQIRVYNELAEAAGLAAIEATKAGRVIGSGDGAILPKIGGTDGGGGITFTDRIRGTSQGGSFSDPEAKYINPYETERQLQKLEFLRHSIASVIKAVEEGNATIGTQTLGERLLTDLDKLTNLAGPAMDELRQSLENALTNIDIAPVEEAFKGITAGFGSMKDKIKSDAEEISGTVGAAIGAIASFRTGQSIQANTPQPLLPTDNPIQFGSPGAFGKPVAGLSVLEPLPEGYQTGGGLFGNASTQYLDLMVAEINKPQNELTKVIADGNAANQELLKQIASAFNTQPALEVTLNLDSDKIFNESVIRRKIAPALDNIARRS